MRQPTYSGLLMVFLLRRWTSQLKFLSEKRWALSRISFKRGQGIPKQMSCQRGYGNPQIDVLSEEYLNPQIDIRRDRNPQIDVLSESIWESPNRCFVRGEVDSAMQIFCQRRWTLHVVACRERHPPGFYIKGGHTIKNKCSETTLGLIKIKELAPSIQIKELPPRRPRASECQ